MTDRKSENHCFKSALCLPKGPGVLFPARKGGIETILGLKQPRLISQRLVSCRKRVCNRSAYNGERALGRQALPAAG